MRDTNELYTNEELFRLIRQEVRSEVRARSFRLGSSRLDENHLHRIPRLSEAPWEAP